MDWCWLLAMQLSYRLHHKVQGKPTTQEETSLINVKVVALGTVVRVELPEGSTVADAANEARVDETLVCQYRGNQIAPADRASHSVEDGATLIFVAPALKHGDE